MGGRPTDSVQRATTSSPAGAATVRATDEEPAVTNRHGRRTSAERGVAAVEFALLLPVLLLFIFGIIQFGRGFNAKVTLTHAAREGVRALAIDPADTSGAEMIAIDRTNGLSGVTATAATNCAAAPPNDTVTMTVNYAIDYPIPFFGSVTGTISEDATMRCGG